MISKYLVLNLQIKNILQKSLDENKVGTKP